MKYQFNPEKGLVRVKPSSKDYKLRKAYQEGKITLQQALKGGLGKKKFNA